MANVIVIKKGAGIPAPDQLKEAELALDVTDGSLYSKLQDGDIHQLNDGADDVDLSDYVLEAPDDGVLYGRQSKDWVEVVIPDGGTGSSVHIGDTPPEDPQEGQQWMEVPASGDAIMWIYDGAVWLEQPSNGGSSVDLTGYATETYVGDAIAAIPATDLSDYYTSTEADEKFQPKGDYIGDAPSDGNLYIRKDGGWEAYVPSSGGDGNLISPIIQPITVGNFTCQEASQWITDSFKPDDTNGTTRTFTVPSGYKFILQNIFTSAHKLRANEVIIDGVKPYGSVSDSSEIQNKYLWTGDGQLGKSNFLVSESISVHLRSSYSNGTTTICGMFIPSDDTYESAEIRDAYVAANIEAWEALTPPEPEEVTDGPVTQEIPDE
jgi:hypothetical protein